MNQSPFLRIVPNVRLSHSGTGENQVKNRRDISGEIAEFIRAAKPAKMAQEVRETAKGHLLDGLATMLGGVAEDPCDKIRRHIAQIEGRGEATVLGTTLKAPCQQAALANGVQGHVLDYDDTQLTTSRKRPFGHLTHPTVPVLAASLAMAEKIQAGGGDLLRAYIVGVEVSCRLADAIDPSHYLSGFHPTGSIGVFGATAACCSLLKLDESNIRWALGIAASFSASIRGNRGTMTKSLNAGRAAENGVLAALLAAEGFTASPSIFEVRMGYLSAFSRNRLNRRVLTLGRPYFFSHPGVAIKPYPCGSVMHPALDVLLDLVHRHNIRPEEILRVRVGMSSQATAPLVYPEPATGLQAKFSMPFCAAVALLERRVDLDQFTDEKVRDPGVRALMKRVVLYRDGELERLGYEHARAKIEIRLKDRRIYRGRGDVARGHPMKPLSRDDLGGKFRDCALRCLEPAEIQEIIEDVWSLERLSAVGSLVQRMVGKKIFP